jgi:hypothetical protein
MIKLVSFSPFNAQRDQLIFANRHLVEEAATQSEIINSMQEKPKWTTATRERSEFDRIAFDRKLLDRKSIGLINQKSI